MDSDDGKEKGGVTAVRKGEAMKSLEKATADYGLYQDKNTPYRRSSPCAAATD